MIICKYDCDLKEEFSMSLQNKIIEYLEYCEYRKELDKKTLKAYRIDLRQYSQAVSVEIPGKRELEKFITNLHKTYKQKTVKRKIASIKAFYNYLEQEEIIEDNPFRKVKVKFKETIRLPRIIPRGEIEQLLNYMYASQKEISGESKYKLRDIAVVEMCFATGARVSEISNIKEENVDLNTGAIRIMGKGGKERYIQIADSSVLELLRKYYQSNQYVEAVIFL